MLRKVIPAFCVAAMLVSSSAIAAKPKNATARCTDGTYSEAKNEQGACSKHGGVAEWYGGQASPTTTTTTAVRAVPKNATAKCVDGTFSTAKTRQGACSKHGGVQTWFADESTSTPAPAPVTVPMPAPVPASRTVSTKTTTTVAPGSPTAKCKDGTLSYAATHRGACSHHGGVAEWYK